jgi:hypothetical protein
MSENLQRTLIHGCDPLTVGASSELAPLSTPVGSSNWIVSTSNAESSVPTLDHRPVNITHLRFNAGMPPSGRASASSRISGVVSPASSVSVMLVGVAPDPGFPSPQVTRSQPLREMDALAIATWAKASEDKQVAAMIAKISSEHPSGWRTRGRGFRRL